MQKPTPNEFEQVAQEVKDRGVVAEFFGFLRENKKWWLWPVVILFLVLGLLVFLSGTGFAPFVYTLF